MVMLPRLPDESCAGEVMSTVGEVVSAVPARVVKVLMDAATALPAKSVRIPAGTEMVYAIPFASVRPLTLLRSNLAPLYTVLMTSTSFVRLTLATTLLLELRMLMKPDALNLTGSLKIIVAVTLLVGTSVAPTGGYMDTKVGAAVSAVALVEPATAGAKPAP